MKIPRGTFGRFRPVKEVCKRCMAKYRLPIIQWRQEGVPIEWNSEDDSLWERGQVHCPQAARPSMVLAVFCLRRKEVEVVEKGVLPIWDEKDV